MSYLEQFNHRFYGPPTGPKLVFLHGLMGSLTNWRKIISAFEADYHILAYDQRGHGRSFHPDTGYDPEDFAGDLLHILDELKWSKVYLVGHSMGGRNALNFAARFPQRVQALVIEDIGPEGNPANKGRTRQLLDMVPTPFPSKDAAKRFLLNDFVNRLGGGDEAKTLAQYFYTNIEEKKRGQADWRFSKAAVLHSLEQGNARPRWTEWEALKVPTLIIRGEHSRELPREMFQKMLVANPRAQGQEIADAGHWVHYEQSGAFIDALKGFFSSVA